MPTPDDLKRFQILVMSVESAVSAGRSITISRNDKSRRFVRFLDTQKRAIGMNMTTFILTATIVTLGGPIAAAVALGGSLIGFGLSTAWDRWMTGRSRGKYQKKKAAGVTLTKTETLNLAQPVAGGPTTFESQVVNENYAELVDDVKSVLSRQGLTDVYNTLANLDTDFLRLSKFITSTQVGGPWIKGTFGPTRLYPTVPTAVAGTVRIQSCDDIVQLWEALKLIDNRFEKVRETVAMLDEFIKYATFVTSQYEHDERKLLPAAWKKIEAESRVGTTVNCKQLFDRFNNAVKTHAIQKFYGRRLTSRTKDYSAWVYSMIPDFVKAGWDPGFRLDIELELLRRNDKAAFVKAKAAIVAKFLSAAGKEYVGGVVSLPDEIPSSWSDAGLAAGSTATAAGITVGSAYLTGFLEGMQSDAWRLKYTAVTAKDLAESADQSTRDGNIDTAKSLLDPLTFSKGVTPQHYLSMATAVVKVAIEVANAHWNERKLATGQTLGLTGMRQQSIGERIGTLRTFAKDEIDDYIENVDDWKEAHSLLLEGKATGKYTYTIQSLAAAFLTYQKCVEAKYSNRTGQFFEELVAVANEMSMTAEAQTKLAEKAVMDFLASTKHSRACRAGRYCYGPASARLKAWIRSLKKMDASLAAGLNENALNASWDAIPACCIEGDCLEEFKMKFLDTLPRHLQQRAWELEYGE